MAKKERQPKKKAGRPRELAMPDPIPDTPENIARACMQGALLKDEEWDYLKPGSGARVERDGDANTD